MGKVMTISTENFIHDMIKKYREHTKKMEESSKHYLDDDVYEINMEEGVWEK